MKWFKEFVKLSFGFASVASAQVPFPEGAPKERPPLPGFLREVPAPRFELPSAPVFPEPRLSPAIRIFVARFKVTGATAFPPAELESLVARHAGRVIGNDELEEARLAITRHYVAAGYINSGATIPDQEVRDGVVEIQVQEGRLTQVAISGTHGFRPSFIEDRVAVAAGPPLNVNQLQEGIQLLLQNPLIERINAELGAGTKPGESVLRMDVAGAQPGTYAFSFANNRSPAVGGERAEAMLGYGNLTGRGDNGTLRLGYGQGINDFTAIYSVPVSARDTLIGFKFERTDTEVVEPPFDLIGIANRSDYVELGIAHPFYRTLSRRLDLGALLTRRDNASSISGLGFSFVGPEQDRGRAVVTAVRLVGDWTDRSADRVFAARFTASHGINALDATVLEVGIPDSLFATRLAQLQLAQRMSPDGDQLILRGDWQRANGALVASEKFSVGGMQSVRGYRENALVRDNGWAASAEYRWRYGNFDAAFFGDLGAARDDGGASDYLKSVGWGLRWTPWPGVLAQFYKGYAMVEPPNKGDDLQDRGYHFSAAIQRSF